MLGFADERVRSFSLTSWGNAHTLAVVLATGAAVGLDNPPLLAWVAGASFLILVVQTRGTWTPRGQLGAANLVTTLRLLMTLGLLVAYPYLHDGVLCMAALSILILDGVDGWLARRYAGTSEFGARYDVEVDALFVIALAVILLARGAAGPWVLLAGLWRYIYILARILVPSPVEAPRTLFGRITYVLMLSCFILALWLPPSSSAPVAAIGTLALSISFLRSFWQAYFPARPA